MAMPNDLVLVRHGESEGNVVTGAAKDGDTSGYTDTYMATPGSQWRLTERGREQARTIGAWLQEEAFADRYFARPSDPRFDRWLVSPYVRTRETAAHLGMAGARWQINRALRERDWGDISLIPRSEFTSAAWWIENAKTKHLDPLYWCAPNGESVAMIAEDRVRNVLDTLHRECDGKRVVTVSHAETIVAFRLVLERWSDEQYAQAETDRSERIGNCEAIHYSRWNPHATEPIRPAERLTWLRRARPVQDADGTWRVEVDPWRKLDFSTYDNDELLAQVDPVPSLLG